MVEIEIAKSRAVGRSYFLGKKIYLLKPQDESEKHIETSIFQTLEHETIHSVLGKIDERFSILWDVIEYQSLAVWLNGFSPFWEYRRRHWKNVKRFKRKQFLKVYRHFNSEMREELRWLQDEIGRKNKNHSKDQRRA